MNKIFQWNPERDLIENVGITSHTLAQIANLSGYGINDLYNEIDNRKLVLRHMINHNIRSVKEVNGVLEQYYKNPQKVLNRIILNR